MRSFQMHNILVCVGFFSITQKAKMGGNQSFALDDLASESDFKTLLSLLSQAKIIFLCSVLMK